MTGERVRIAFIGDIVGRAGRRVAARAIAWMRRHVEPDVIVANAENSAGGFGIHRAGIEELSSAGVDFFTTGNHVWDKPPGIALLDERDDIVRPANYPDAPGRGWAPVPGTEGRIVVVNVQGRVFMPPLDCPFRTVDGVLASLPETAKVVIVDCHAEATSEKIAMGWHLDGRASMVVGTHTHVPTRDARVLPGGTAYVTDVGMTGGYEGILGVRREAVIRRFFHQRPVRFEVARGDPRCDFVVVDVDGASGRALGIEHHQYRPGEEGQEERE